MKDLFRKLLTISGILVLLVAGMPSAALVRAETPTADFSADPTSGLAPLAVQYTDESGGAPTGWAWYFGDEDCSTAWEAVTPNGDWWSARHAHTSVVLPDGNIVLMGGTDGNSYKNDVWRSVDGGVTWSTVTPSASWSERYFHNSVVMADGSILLMGGYDGNIKNDVWRSEDEGATWTPVTANAGWSTRYSHTSVVLPDGSIVLMGGYDGNLKNDVWRSEDEGATWTEVTSAAGWSGRYGHTSVVMPDGSILLMGGRDGSWRNDVWRSEDGGANWTQLTTSAAWSVRDYHTNVVLPDGSILLMGGYDSTSNKNDLWRSDDHGATWTQVNASAGWSARRHHTSEVLADGRIVLIGGYDTSSKNDVWRLATAGSNEQHPLHIYTETGTYTVTFQAYNANGMSRISKADYIDVESIPVEAEFTAVPTSGEPPLTVQFTDQSSGDPTGWAWYFGDEDLSATWEEAAPSSVWWSARSSHTSVVLPDGNIVLMGGYDGNYKNDVWHSTNGGGSWAEVTASAGWSARYGHASVVLLDGIIVLMGGYDSSRKNDVWRSSDGGATWEQVTAGAGWSARESHTSVVLPDGSILLMGGFDSSYSYKNDVWRSTDGGANWTLVTADAEWSARFGHKSVVLADGSIVLMGGHDGIYKNDVWRSSDGGATWTQVTASAGWSIRRNHASVILPDGSIVLMGGNNDGIKNTNDVWRSVDGGETWTALTTSAEWPARSFHTSVVLPDGRIVLMGGLAGYMNDVYRLTTTGSHEQNPEHVYTEPGTYTVTLQAYKANGISRISKPDHIFVGYKVFSPLIIR